jgi:hypothetical protein
MKSALLLTAVLLSGCATLDDYLHSATATTKDVISGFKCDIQGHSFSFCADDVKPASYKP